MLIDSIRARFREDEANRFKASQASTFNADRIVSSNIRDTRYTAPFHGQYFSSDDMFRATLNSIDSMA